MNEPLRVLQVLGGLNRGGAESMVMNLYRTIDREKIQFDFVVHTDEFCAFNDEVFELGGRIYCAPRYKVTNHITYTKWWKNFFKSHSEYKIVHGHMFSIASIYLNIAKKFGIITIAHSHSSSEKLGISGVVKKIIQQPLKNISDWLFACSIMAGNWLYGKNFESRKNGIIVKNAISTSEYVYNPTIAQKMRAELGVEGKFVVGHVGRFCEAKNHMYLLDVFGEILKKNEESVLLIVGDGELRTQIEEKAEKMGIKDKLIMTGVRNDVNDLLQAMDCFVFPSVYEGVPLTVIEAQAAGLPCFVSDTITDEVCITKLVHTLSIADFPTVWSDEILKITPGLKREDTKQLIVKAGYDVNTTASWITNFYMDCIK